MKDKIRIDTFDMILNCQTKINTYARIFEKYGLDIEEQEQRDFFLTYSMDLFHITAELQEVLDELDSPNEINLSDKELEMFRFFKELDDDYQTKLRGEIVSAAAEKRILKKEQGHE